ncbi:hypothetical protein JR316_0013178 [Psilocybe cubensis]|uniref:Uncharacterized protein n=2 Tax=Psilocybe cubensis TaxID=181762 RepID=A0ACB8GGJ5_PSICU|nr:hypothetical protein JR316_0013178 [Psilocybe cubensis]KAH9474713.1 hypothetical protein JR316_0013178 [Psilocybe cubensis]
MGKKVAQEVSTIHKKTCSTSEKQDADVAATGLTALIIAPVEDVAAYALNVHLNKETLAAITTGYWTLAEAAVM